MIVLTADEAAKVRGISPTQENAGLDPVPLKDGTFILGEEVLSDPAHADVRAFLAKLPTVKSIDASLSYGIDDEAAIIAKAFPEMKAAGVRKPIADDVKSAK